MRVRVLEIKFNWREYLLYLGFFFFFNIVYVYVPLDGDGDGGEEIWFCLRF